MVTRPLAMRVSMVWVLRQAADTIDELAAKVREDADWHPDDDTDDPAGDASCNSFMLRELAKHAAGVAAGRHSLADFAEFYCLSRPVVRWAGEPNSAGRA